MSMSVYTSVSMSRWDPSRPPVAFNLVLLAHTENQKMNSSVDGRDDIPVEIRAKITARLKWAEEFINDGLIGDNSIEGVYLSLDGYKKNKKSPSGSFAAMPFGAITAVGTTCLAIGILVGTFLSRFTNKR